MPPVSASKAKRDAKKAERDAKKTAEGKTIRKLGRKKDATVEESEADAAARETNDEAATR